MVVKKRSVNVSRILLAAVIGFCILGNLVSFFNIDLGVVVLTPFRLVLIIASIWCLAIWWNCFRKNEVLSVLKSNFLQCLMFGFFVIWFGSGLFWVLLGNTGTNAPADVMGIFTTCLLSFCLLTLVKDSKDVRFLLQLCVLCGVILALLACVEVVYGNFVAGTKFHYTLAERIELEKTFFPPTTVFYNPNDFAAFMLLCLSIVSFWIIRAKTILNYLCSVGIAVILVIPVILTDSTIFNLMATCLALLTIMGLLLCRRRWKSRLVRAFGIVLFSVVFVMFCVDGVRSVAVQLNQSYFTTRIQEYYLQNVPIEPGQGDIITDPDVDPSVPGGGDSEESIPPTTPPWIPEGGTSNGSGSDTLADQLDAFSKNGGTIYIRSWLIRIGWDFFLDSPIVGCGPDSFQVKISQNPDYLDKTRGVVNPHFFYTELLSQYGIGLFAIYIGIILTLTVRSLILTFRELRDNRPGRGVLCLLLTLMFSVAIVMPSTIVRLTPIWIFLVAAICVLSKGLPTEEKKVSEECSEK